MQAAHAPLGGSVAQGTVPAWAGFALLGVGQQRKAPVHPTRRLETWLCLFASGRVPPVMSEALAEVSALSSRPQGLEGGWRPDPSSSWIWELERQDQMNGELFQREAGPVAMLSLGQ